MLGGLLIHRDVLFTEALGVLRENAGKKCVHAPMPTHAFRSVIKLRQNREFVAMLLQLLNQFRSHVIATRLLRKEQLRHKAKIRPHTHHPHGRLDGFPGGHDVQVRQGYQCATDSAEERSAIQRVVGLDQHVRSDFQYIFISLTSVSAILKELRRKSIESQQSKPQCDLITEGFPKIFRRSQARFKQSTR
jgi:hypothetical protein